jgi:hypothetical protein
MAHDGSNLAVAINDLQLLTTRYRPTRRLFDAFGDTSAAMAGYAVTVTPLMTNSERSCGGACTGVTGQNSASYCWK